MKNILSLYRGPLLPAQAAAGMAVAARNAKRLADDAQLLLEAKRFATAASLAILALEEHGKSSIIRGLVAATSEQMIADGWRAYRKHTAKNFMALMPALVAQGARRLAQFRSLFTKEADAERAIYDVVKQLGFYTDCCGAAHWSAPNEVIDGALASKLVAIARALTGVENNVTVRELELWAEHMRNGMTRDNLLRWSAAMVAEGFKTAEYLTEMSDFVADTDVPLS